MISIVIRAKNEACNLNILFDILNNQTVDNEIIIVDSNSEDDTEDICNKYGCKVIQSSKPFSYGKALNEGINETKNRYISILSAHCFPTDRNFLYNMLYNFNTYENIAGVYAKQIPHKNTNSLEYRNFIHMYGNDKIIQYKTPMFNNGASMIDKDVWNKMKFDEKVIAQEDILWAKNVQDMGYKIIYEPICVVEHLHDEGIMNTINRYDREYRALRDMEYLKW